MLLFSISLSLMISENTEKTQQNKCRTDRELTLTKMHFLCGDARSQERFQRISNPFYLLHFTVFYLTEIKDLSIRGTNLQQRQKTWTVISSSIAPEAVPFLRGLREVLGKAPSSHSPRCARRTPAAPAASASCGRTRWGSCSGAGPPQLPPSCSPRRSRCTGCTQASSATWAAPPGSDGPRLGRAAALGLTCTGQPGGRIAAHQCSPHWSNSSCKPLPWIHGLQVAKN